MTSPTPKVLTEADLAGLPRAVSTPNDLPSVGTDDARSLADEMDAMSERITRYSNGPGDGLLAIGAETVRNLVSERDELRAACRAPLSEIEVNTGWKDSPAFTSIMGSRGQAFEAGVRFAELKHGIATSSVSERDALAGRVAELEAERKAARSWLFRVAEELARFSVWAKSAADCTAPLNAGDYEGPRILMTQGRDELRTLSAQAIALRGEMYATLSATTPESKP